MFVTRNTLEKELLKQKLEHMKEVRDLWLALRSLQDNQKELAKNQVKTLKLFGS